MNYRINIISIPNIDIFWGPSWRLAADRKSISNSSKNESHFSRKRGEHDRRKRRPDRSAYSNGLNEEMPPLIGHAEEPKLKTSPRPRSQICAYIGNWLPNRFRAAPKHVFFPKKSRVVCTYAMRAMTITLIENSGSVCRSYRAGCLKNLLTIFYTYLRYRGAIESAIEWLSYWVEVISNSCECKWHTHLYWSLENCELRFA